jgi:precorrin-6x reductase
MNVEEWVEYFFQFPEHTLDISPVYGQIPLKISAIPDHIREEKIEYLNSLNHPFATQISNIASTYTYSKEYFEKFKRKTELDDKIRKTSVFDLNKGFYRVWNYGKLQN